MGDITTSLATRLTDLSRNLWWTWHPEVVAIFRDVEPALWREVNHNPIAFVRRLTPEQWSRHAEETALSTALAALSNVRQEGGHANHLGHFRAESFSFDRGRAARP
jgi:glucan phosphorylase